MQGYIIFWGDPNGHASAGWVDSKPGMENFRYILDQIQLLPKQESPANTSTCDHLRKFWTKVALGGN